MRRTNTVHIIAGNQS